MRPAQNPPAAKHQRTPKPPKPKCVVSSVNCSWKRRCHPPNRGKENDKRSPDDLFDAIPPQKSSNPQTNRSPSILIRRLAGRKQAIPRRPIRRPAPSVFSSYQWYHGESLTRRTALTHGDADPDSNAQNRKARSMKRLLALCILLTGATTSAWGATQVMVQDFEKNDSLPSVWVVNIPNENALVKLSADRSTRRQAMLEIALSLCWNGPIPIPRNPEQSAHRNADPQIAILAEGRQFPLLLPSN